MARDMTSNKDNLLAAIKQEKWFYEFLLPDGTVTDSYLPEEARAIHHTRERALIDYLESKAKAPHSALDVGCHEGYFSMVLARYCTTVVGIDKNAKSLDKGRRILSLLDQDRISLVDATLEQWPDDQAADLVLCFGLLYHVEDPINVLRRLVSLTRESLVLETQVLPFEANGEVEDGSCQWKREIQGIFGICVDYPDRAEGGLTDLALVPSRDAVGFLLNTLGCNNLQFYQPHSDDYEQFRRGQRVIVFADKED
jgi:SAM-dependent methyltransferase